jgi:hypothetical protein
MTRTPIPGGAEMGERLRLKCASATIPPAREFQVARTARSPGFGRNHGGLPGIRPSGRTVYICPLQWRGRAGLAPASVNPRSLEPNSV